MEVHQGVKKFTAQGKSLFKPKLNNYIQIEARTPPPISEIGHILPLPLLNNYFVFFCG